MYKFIWIVTMTLAVSACDSQKLGISSLLSSLKTSKATEAKTETEFYTCSMHPHVKESHPGKCPVCQMNLTKVTLEHDDASSDSLETAQKTIFACKNYPDVTSEKQDPCPIDGTTMVKRSVGPSPAKVIAKVRLKKAQLQHFQSEVYTVAPMKMSKNLRVLGRVRSAEEKLSTIAARFPARVEKVYVESVGSQIRTGDPVVQVYSPELLTAGEELILSAQKSKGNNEFRQLYAKAREKLILWGIRPTQIRRWVQRGQVPRNVTLYANSSGVVRKRFAIPGKYFREGQNYFELSDLSQVWIEMDVYEHDSNRVQLGQPIALQFVATPGFPKKGQIDFISPTIDEKTRTLKIRTTIANQEGSLKPGMLAQGSITVHLDTKPLVVPSSAIIDTGIRKIVWVQKEKQNYLAKVIETGFQSDGFAEVVMGLQEGERVVLDGNFLLDAQAQFFGGYESFKGNGHNHSETKQ